MGVVIISMMPQTHNTCYERRTRIMVFSMAFRWASNRSKITSGFSISLQMSKKNDERFYLRRHPGQLLERHFAILDADVRTNGKEMEKTKEAAC